MSIVEWICYTGCIASAIACYFSERHSYKTEKYYTFTLGGLLRVMFTILSSWVGVLAILAYHASDIVIIKKK